MGNECLSLSSNARGSLLGNLHGLLLGLGLRLGGGRLVDLLGGLGGTLGLLGDPGNRNTWISNTDDLTILSMHHLLDGLIPLGLSDLGLHVTLGHDLCEGGSDDGTLELLRAAGALLHGLLLDSLLVLAPVQHGPGHLAGVPLHQERALALFVQEREGLQSTRGSGLQTWPLNANP